MKVQLFDSNDRARFTIHTSEAVWSVFCGGASGVAERSPDDSPVADFSLDNEQLLSVIRTVEAALALERQHLPKTPAFASTIEANVLGERVALDLRVESHARLHRLSMLHESLLQFSQMGSVVRVVFVPQLSEAQQHLAVVIKRQPQALEPERVTQALRARYEQLIASDLATQELIAGWRQQTSALDRDDAMPQLLASLERLGLVDTAGGRVRATAKLTLMVL